MRRLFALAAVVAIGAVAMPAGAGAGTSTPQPEVEDHALTAGAEVAAAGFTDELEITDEEVGIVGLKWDGDAEAEFRVMVQHRDGTWEELDDVEPSDIGPDPGSAEDLAARARRGADNVSEPIVVDDPSRVRVELVEGTASNVALTTVTTPIGPSDLVLDDPPDEASALPRVVVILSLAALAIALMIPANRLRLNSWTSLTALLVGVVVVAAGCGCEPSSGQPSGPAPASPPIVSRAGWGADESLRTKSCPEGPKFADVRLAVVHHTAGNNTYTQAAAPGVVRGIYAFHVNSNGWCDVGYNFLVDRFGRIYEGRYGGITRGTIGAHAAGFNTGSVGVASMGNHETVAPSAGTINSIIALLRWKLSIHGVDPHRSVSMGGKTLQAIVGHKDVNATSCPGAHLYSRLGNIRSSVYPHVTSGDPFGNLDSVTRQGPNVRVRGWAIDPKTQNSVPVHVYVGGPPGVGTGSTTVADKLRSDIGAAYPGYGNKRGFDASVPVSGPNDEVCVYLVNSGSGNNTSLGCRGF